jgi:cell wall-associated NlpC family hydrolase
MTRAAFAIAEGENLLGRLVYGFGAKISPALPAERIPEGAPVDCSGFVRWCLVRAGLTDCPDGSAQIHAWAATPGIGHEVPIRFALGLQGAGCLLFIAPRDGHPGHVAISLGQGRSLESHGPTGSAEPSIVGASRNVGRGWTGAAKIDALFREV